MTSRQAPAPRTARHRMRPAPLASDAARPAPLYRERMSTLGDTPGTYVMQRYADE